MALIIITCAAIAYLVNLRRPPDDPKKREYHPLAIILAPVTLPFSLLFFSLAGLLLVLRAILFALFLVVFVPSLVVLRKLEEPLWIGKIATIVGEPLLKLNTYLIKLAISPYQRKA